MEEKLLLIKKSVCLANVYAWSLNFIRTIFTLYYLLTREINDLSKLFFGLYIAQLISSILISISTCSKKCCFYNIALSLQFIYLVVNIFTFFTLLFMDLIYNLIRPDIKIDTFELTFSVIAIPSIFVFFFIGDFEELEVITNRLNNPNENENGLIQKN